MRAILFLIFLPAMSSAQSLQPGNWDVKSTVVDLTVPGTPAFLLRMTLGKSKTEHVCLAADQAKTGVVAMLAPKPEARCSVEQAVVANGRIQHAMSCPQKKGPPVSIVRVGNYGAAGFNARMTMIGRTEKGQMRVVVDQVATRTGVSCRK